MSYFSRSYFFLVGLLCLTLGAVSSPIYAAPTYPVVNWDKLMPKDWDPTKAFKDIDYSTMKDNDPRAQAALDDLKKAWSNAPINPELNGKALKISGYVVPVEFKGKDVTQFLLVPFYGACIHTPPPPSNQIIYVTAATPIKDLNAMDTVWVSGQMTVEKSSTQVATGTGLSSYKIKAVEVKKNTAP
jgi:hypothetical protein